MKDVIKVRPYREDDYEAVAALYKQGDLYGGQFDPDRDSPERLRKRIEADPDVIIVAEQEGEVVGTVSLIEDGRTAWLFRFAVKQGEDEVKVAKALSDKALAALKAKGHRQVLVYTPAGNTHLDGRYEGLGFTRGNDYTCYWKDL